jgi:putative zinc finger/helix-turn-helix YgiT family protein
MKCPNCKHTMENRKSKEYRYLESGLDNVILESIDVFECPCGESIVRIPVVDNLHRHIGLRIIGKKAQLTGKEIRFLRKNMGMSALKLAGSIGVDNATISRWENGKQQVSKSHDLLLRLIYCNMKRINPNDIVHIIQDEFPEVENGKVDIPPYVIGEMELSGFQSCAN